MNFLQRTLTAIAGLDNGFQHPETSYASSARIFMPLL